MVELRERVELRDQEVEERFREVIEHEAPIAHRRPVRWLQWLAGFAILAAAAGAVLFFVLRDSGSETTTDTAAPVAESSAPGYWNSYTNEYVLFESLPSYADGYWNNYTNEWVLAGSVPAYLPGYWNSYTNEYVLFQSLPSYADGYWNNYTNEWVLFTS